MKTQAQVLQHKFLLFLSSPAFWVILATLSQMDSGPYQFLTDRNDISLPVLYLMRLLSYIQK
jgi:hypothetical protein